MKTTVRVLRGVMVAVGLAVASSPAHGDVLVTNLAEPFRASTPIGNNPNPVKPPENSLAWYWAAQSFQTDDNTYRLVSIEAMVGEASIEPVPIVVAELRADDLNTIGILLTPLTAPDLTGALSVHAFAPTEPITLQPNTVYWFVLGSQAPGDGTFLFSYANSDEFVGPGSLAAYADSDDSSATWRYGLTFPYYLQVNVKPLQDTDGDSVDDDVDVCCNTPPGVAVDATGRPIGDLDLDCDNDLDDFAAYSSGFTGPLDAPAECPVTGAR